MSLTDTGRRYFATRADVDAFIAGGGTFAPSNFLDYNEDAGAAYDEVDTFTIPATPFSWLLRMKPLRQSGFSLTVDGSPRTKIRWPALPSAGQYSIDFASGFVRFHSSDEGKEAVATYRGAGSVIFARDLNVIEAFLDQAINVKKEARNFPFYLAGIQDAATASGYGTRFTVGVSGGGRTWRMKSIEVSSCIASVDGATVIKIANGDVGGTITESTNITIDSGAHFAEQVTDSWTCGDGDTLFISVSTANNHANIFGFFTMETV